MAPKRPGNDGGIAQEDGLAPNAPVAEHYLLRLYVTGNTRQSTQAILNMKWLCEKYLKGRYDLEVIDIYQQPELARNAQLIAAPTLVKHTPLPLRRLIGNMSDHARVLGGLGVRPAGSD